MRIAIVSCLATLALFATATSAGASARHLAMGRLVGLTEIDIGCPVVTPGGGCTPTRPYANASFTVTRLNSDGAAVAGTTRTITSNAYARFQVKLRPGAYLITPTPAKGTSGGTPLHERLKANSTQTTTVLFQATVHVA